MRLSLYERWGVAPVGDLKRWLGYIEEHVEYLASLVLAVYPEGSAEHHDARSTRLRLRFFLNVVRVKLGLRPH